MDYCNISIWDYNINKCSFIFLYLSLIKGHITPLSFAIWTDLEMQFWGDFSHVLIKASLGQNLENGIKKTKKFFLWLLKVLFVAEEEKLQPYTKKFVYITPSARSDRCIFLVQDALWIQCGKKVITESKTDVKKWMRFPCSLNIPLNVFEVVKLLTVLMLF